MLTLHERSENSTARISPGKRPSVGEHFWNDANSPNLGKYSEPHELDIDGKGRGVFHRSQQKNGLRLGNGKVKLLFGQGPFGPHDQKFEK